MPHVHGLSEYTVGIAPLTLELHVSLVLEGEFVRDGMVLQVPSWVSATMTSNHMAETYLRWR